MTDSLTFCSMNCQGLSDISKRRDVFNYLKQKKFDIYFLQDIHFLPNELPYIRAMWGYEIFLNSYSTQSRGVAIFFNNTFEYTLHSQKGDNAGNWLLLDISINDKRITLGSIYGPNKDDPEFYIKLKNELQNLDNTYMILGGDFNMAMNHELDTYNYKHENNKKAKDEMHNIMAELNLIDTWRDSNVNEKRFTWFKKTPRKMARLDYFFISENLCIDVIKTDILTGYRTDHSMLYLKLSFQKIEKGKSFWKFNNSLLADKNYVTIVNDTIEMVKEQYKNNYNNINNTETQDLINKDTPCINDQLFLDVLLLEIRGKTISYATFKKKQTRNYQNELIKEINELEKDNEQTDKLEEKKQELYNIRQKHMEGVRVRSRAQWIDQGEKPTKYFCALENRNFISKSMTKLQTNKGIIIENQHDIMQETTSFYKQLYSFREVQEIDLNQEITTNDINKIDDEQRKSIEGNITLEEATNALKLFKNNKSPGTDGFTAEFFKFFWNKLGYLVVNSLNYGFKTEQLSITQREGMITCIPKGTKDKLLLKNWRPISLLNITYKIGSACIANRIKPFLPSIISSDQTGYIAGRFIGENIRTLYDLFRYTEKENKPGLLLLLDFEKAFDSLSWSFIQKTLAYFNFGSDIRKWIKTLYQNIKSCIVVNGHASPFFEIFRGCRQGDPLSPYIFIICTEILAILLKQNKNIKGIEVDGVEFLIGQYADDTSLTLDGSKRSLENSIMVLKFYAKVSGLECNIEKTRVIWFGSKKGCTEKLCRDEHFNWSQDSFTLLGVTFSLKLEEMEKLNYKPKLAEIKRLLSNWSKRKLTPYGKVTVIKSLAISKITHLILAIPNPSQSTINEINTMLYNFLWGGAIDRVKRDVVIKSKQEGGLGMLHFEKFIQSLKLTWLRRYIERDEDKKWCHLFDHMYPFMNKFNMFGSQFITDNLSEIDNKFWYDVFNAYIKLFNQIKPNTWDDILKQPLFLNVAFRIGKTHLYNKRCIFNGIHFINDIVNDDGSFMSFNAFRDMYNNVSNFIEYGTILKLIKTFMAKHEIIPKNYKLTSAFQNIPLGIIISDRKGCRNTYQTFIENNALPTALQKWKEENIIQENTEWNSSFKKTFLLTKDTNLIWLQFRLSHRILATNSLLYKMKVTNTDKCTFCNSERETLLHLFWECIHITQFWRDVTKLLKQTMLCDSTKHLDIKDILFGSKKIRNKMNLIVLIAKRYIYRSKMENKIPRIGRLLGVLSFQYEVEKTIACRNSRIEQFNEYWWEIKQVIELGT